MQFSPVKRNSAEVQIPVFQPKKIRDKECVEELKKVQCGCDGRDRLWTDTAQRNQHLLHMDVSMSMLLCCPNTEGLRQSSGPS